MTGHRLVVGASCVALHVDECREEATVITWSIPGRGGTYVIARTSVARLPVSTDAITGTSEARCVALLMRDHAVTAEISVSSKYHLRTALCPKVAEILCARPAVRYPGGWRPAGANNDVRQATSIVCRPMRRCGTARLDRYFASPSGASSEVSRGPRERSHSARILETERCRHRAWETIASSSELKIVQKQALQR